jgi:hypothetical protein
MTANEAFQQAGVNFTLPQALRVPALSLFTAMECASLRLLNSKAAIALSGSMGPVVAADVRCLLGADIKVYDEWCAAHGLSKIARDVFSGKTEILGIEVDHSR